MDQSAFDKELAKYKIVREETYCKPRSKNNLISIKPSPRPLPLGDGTKKKLLLEEPGAAHASFWELLEKAGADVLTSEENAKFIAAMRKAYSDVPELVNLEDLNAAAALVKANG